MNVFGLNVFPNEEEDSDRVVKPSGFWRICFNLSLFVVLNRRCVVDSGGLAKFCIYPCRSIVVCFTNPTFGTSKLFSKLLKFEFEAKLLRARDLF